MGSIQVEEWSCQVGAQWRVQQEEDALNWCRDKGWLTIEEQQWKLLAMIQRGLVLYSTEDCLTCIHCPKQLWSFDHAVQHFTVVKNIHRHDRPCLQELADNIETQHLDATTGGVDVLSRFFGWVLLHGAFSVFL